MHLYENIGMVRSEHRMKVFFYITSLAMGGAEMQCARLAVALKELYGCDVELIVNYPQLSNERLLGPIKDAGIPVHGHSWKTVAGIIGMYRLLKSGGSGSVLFCYNAFPDFTGAIIGRVAGIKNVYAGVRSTYLPRVHIWMERFVQRFLLRGTIFNSHRAREEFVDNHGFTATKSLVISNAIPDTPFRHDYSKQNDRVEVITVGTFKPPKDYHTWLKVIAKARESNPKIHGIIVGYGWQESSIRDWINELHLDDVVDIVNGKGIEDIPQRLAAADIYLSTSISEGTSNSIMEALRAGIPVVATDVGDNRYLIQEERSGFIRNVSDEQLLAEAVVELSQDPDMRERFGANAVKNMKANHSIERIASRYYELLSIAKQ